jgi:hypothetical protein
VIYFIYAADNEQGSHERIKVGRATNWSERWKQHLRGHFGAQPVKQPLCVVRGLPVHEGAIHNHFIAHLWRGSGEKEVYHPAPDLIDYIRWLRDQHFVWAPPGEDQPEIHELPRATASRNRGPKTAKPRFLGSDAIRYPLV